MICVLQNNINNESTINHLYDPSLIESTPMPRQQHNLKNKLSRVNLSPIVKQLMIPEAEIEPSSSLPKSIAEEVESEYPSLSVVSVGDLTSLLSKTGKCELPNDLNITEALSGNYPENNEDIMNELESLMTRLDNVFNSFHDSSYLTTNSSSRLHKGLNLEIGQLVSEIGDQLYAFTHNNRN